ncbi:MAG: hypothetical protein ABIH23_16395, partial [bacterium]
MRAHIQLPQSPNTICFATLSKEDRIMARIYLFVPPGGLYRRDDRCQSRVEDQTIRAVFPPLDLAYMAALLRKAGHEVRVADYPAMRSGADRLREDLLEFA